MIASLMNMFLTVQIVGTNGDVELTATELESFDTAFRILKHDLKYRTLTSQTHWIRHLLDARDEAIAMSKVGYLSV